MRPPPPPSNAPLTALALSGGGARGAYQAGVLKGLLEIGVLGEAPFQVMTGSSAGAINIAALASRADDIAEGIANLERVWREIRADRVFRTDLRSLGGIGLRWMRDLSLGGMLQRAGAKALLDTAPLRDMLRESIALERIQENIDRGSLHAVAIPATNLHTADGVIFVQGRPDLPLWQRGRWSIERAELGVDHLMASSAIPVFFPSVPVDGRHLGDGCIRNTAPLSPAISLGADRIVAVGVRRSGAPTEPRMPGAQSPAPTIAQIAGVLLDAVMLDAFEADVEHSGRVNRSVMAYPTGERESPFRWIDVLWLSPSREFGSLAAEHLEHVPRIVRYLMRGLGPDETTTELASYLLFDSRFCSRLIELGEADVHDRRNEIADFFAGRGAPEIEGAGRDASGIVGA